MESIVTRSFCGVYTNSFTITVAGLTGLDAPNKQSGKAAPSSVVWAVAIDSGTKTLDGENLTDRGRAVIRADAGWLGNFYSPR